MAPLLSNSRYPLRQLLADPFVSCVLSVKTKRENAAEHELLRRVPEQVHAYAAADLGPACAVDT